MISKLNLMLVIATIAILIILGMLQSIKDDINVGAARKLTGLNVNSSVATQKMPRDFAFRYSFGISERNVLDTAKNLYIKDMVCDPPQDYKVTLTEDEKRSVYNSLVDNDFSKIKNDLTDNCDDSGRCIEIDPLWGATLTVTINGEKKTVKWRANYYYEDDPDAVRFGEIKSVIEGIISEKEEELKIPEPGCGYL
ncbi:MAG: hypothetical protein JXB14_03170 [Candidatus Altiarchaeota archaeon]|nr:hypothetical protein [Candidatus Altiarchaeota archaeon]